ncbi:hypothetical protein RF55_17299 [Lasius niger]|uniref:Uncharacterized protein n=1 Tax=Lasius niger TaxID=67767 RepID=A0A0J7K301_LASNI|nr:hypothetical protein RF55_17299 [Lasius niger]
MDTMAFIIAEFNDGLHLILESWYNASKQSCIWPSHFKTKMRINKAIITREMPQNHLEWDELPIKRVFGKADSNINTHSFTNNRVRNFTEQLNGDSDSENNYTREYKKLTLGKLNKILYKLHTIETKIDILEEKMQPINSFSQENNVKLPISTNEELTYFEEQLHERQFKEEVV